MIGRWLNLVPDFFRRDRPASRDMPAPKPQPPPEFDAAVPVPPGPTGSPFTPTRPVLAGAALFGRQRQIERAMAAIERERAHLAIFGERGHGKTSLANVLAARVEAAGYGVVRIACSAGANFSDLIGAVLDRMPPRFLRRVAAEPASATPPPWTVADATTVLERIRAGHVLVFIDEFDRLRDDVARRDVTELLKNIADQNLRVSFVLIGVAESLEDLLALHQSVHRSLVAIPVPLLTEADLAALIEHGCASLRLNIEPAALTALLALAHRSPYYAQLLSLHATDATRRRGGDRVTAGDVADAAALVLEETQTSIMPLLARLPEPAEAWTELLFAAARAPCDGFGWFPATAVAAKPKQGGPAIATDTAAALSRMTDPETGPILRTRHTGGGAEFAFARANLRNHLLLCAASRPSPSAVARPRTRRPVTSPP